MDCVNGKWCQEEVRNPSRCFVCGEPATCSGNNGYLCDSKLCWEEDDRISQKKFNEKYGSNYE